MKNKAAIVKWASLLCIAIYVVTACQMIGMKNKSGDNMRPIFDGKSFDGWVQVPPDSWDIKGNAMSSKGTGRGVIYTEEDFENYRAIFTMRHIGVRDPWPGEKKKGGDHHACVLVFCTRPVEGVKGDSALNGIQFQPPNGGSWDYRKGKNNDGTGRKGEPVVFKRVFDPRKAGPEGTPLFDEHEWHQVELLVNAKDGTARMAVAQPVGTKAIEVLQFNDPTAAKIGPLAFQIHNAGLLDEYKDIYIEENPKLNDLITTK